MSSPPSSSSPPLSSSANIGYWQRFKTWLTKCCGCCSSTPTAGKSKKNQVKSREERDGKPMKNRGLPKLPSTILKKTTIPTTKGIVIEKENLQQSYSFETEDIDDIPYIDASMINLSWERNDQS